MGVGERLFDRWTRRTMRRRFGPYADLFPAVEIGPSYLSLLHLKGPEAVEAVGLVRAAAARDREGRQASVLLADWGWRLQLVGGTACYLLPRNRPLTLLWSAIDSGSWVSPQLAAVASLVDPRFGERAVDRLGRGCPIDSGGPRHVGPKGGGSDVERHTAHGPGHDRTRSAKTASALWALLGPTVGSATGDGPGDSIDAIDSPSLRDLIEADVDDGAERATGWRRDLPPVAEGDVQPYG